MTYDEEKKVKEIVQELIVRIDELRAENRQLKMIEAANPIYSRRKLERNFSEAMTKLQKVTNKYVELASKQSDGFWNAEEETDVRECRAFINRVLGSE